MTIATQAPNPVSPSWPTYVDLILKVVTLVVVCFSALMAYRQIVKLHDWNRRKASQDLAFDIVNGNRTEAVRQFALKYGVKLADPNSPTYEQVVAKLPEADRLELQLTVRWLLNHAETLAIGLKNHVYDEEMTYDHSSLVISNFWQWAQPYVKTIRAIDPTIWNEQEFYAKRWAKRGEEEMLALRNPGKSPT